MPKISVIVPLVYISDTRIMVIRLLITFHIEPFIFRFRPVRRFFCLLVTFDFLFTGLFWVITVIVPGGSIEKTLWEMIAHYTIQNSLFDIVVSRINCWDKRLLVIKRNGEFKWYHYFFHFRYYRFCVLQFASSFLPSSILNIGGL